MNMTGEAYRAMLGHARACLPEEACGMLAGTGNTIRAFYPLENILHAGNRFAADPRAQFDALREIRREGMALLGIWHSHPHAPAVPSEADIRSAGDPHITYCILSLAPKADLRAYRIACGRYEEIQMIIREK